MIDPMRIPRTISPVTSTGARFPGTSAVVMHTSVDFSSRAISSRSLAAASAETSFAYPFASSARSSRPTATKRAPRLSTCSLTTGRMSKPVTTAPSRRAVAIACRPATPAPSTNTLAGRTVPAAVMSMGKNLGSASAARSTLL